MSLKTLHLKSTGHKFIQYDYNPELLDKIKNLYNKLPEPKLTELIIAEEVYSSCAMEGAVSTVADSIQLLSDEKNPSNYSEQMIYNFLGLIKNPMGSALFEDILNIRKVWDILSKDAIDSKDDGYPFRSKAVYIANPYTGKVFHEGLESSYLNVYLTSLYNYLYIDKREDEIIKALILHFCFEHWHPFCDCNGRTGRYLMSEYIIQNGYDKFMYLPINTVLYRDKLNYDAALHINKQNPSIVGYLDYMLNILIIVIQISLFVNIDTDLGEFLRKVDSRYVSNDTPMSILQELSDNDLIDNSFSYSIQLKDSIYKAIQIYKRGLE